MSSTSDKILKTVQAIEKSLDSNGIKHEEIEYSVFLYNVGGYVVQTDNCSIEVSKNGIEVNEKPVDGIKEMLVAVKEVEA